MSKNNNMEHNRNKIEKMTRIIFDMHKRIEYLEERLQNEPAKTLTSPIGFRLIKDGE